MSQEDRDALDNKLGTLSNRIEANIKEYKERGEPSDEHESFADYLRKAHTALRDKLAAAAHAGDEWKVFKYELELDINSLMEKCQKWENDLDAEAAKAKK